MRRLVIAYKDRGAKTLASKNRGKPSNNAYSKEHQEIVVELVSEHYTDFDPTLAADIVNNMRLGVALAFVQEKQEPMNTERSTRTPKRRGKKIIHREKNVSLG